MSEPKPSRLPQIAVGSALLAVAVSVIAAIVVFVRDDAPPAAKPSTTLAPLIDQPVAVADIVKLRDNIEVVVDAGTPRGVRVSDPALAKALGLQDDDILTALLGRKLTRESDVSDVMTRARLLHATTLYAELERGGASTVLRWQLDGDLGDAQRAARPGSLGTLGTPPTMPPTTPPTTPDPGLKNPFADPDPDPVLDAIKQIDATHTRVPKKTFEALLAYPTAYVTSARVVPSVKNGDPDGYKLFAIRPGSLFDRLGLKNGDTVHSINGAPLAEVDDVVSLLVDAKNKKRIFLLDVTRRGKPVQLEIEITP